MFIFLCGQITSGKGFKLPEIKSFLLQNGLKLMVIERHDQPAVLFSLMFRTGYYGDPQGKEGLTEVVGALLRQGTEKYSAEQIAERIDYYGFRFDLETEDEYTILQMMTLKKDYGICLELLTEIVTSPAFAESEIEQVKKEFTNRIKSELDQPRIIADQHLRFLIFGREPLGLNKTVKSIASITRRDIITWHKQAFSPSKSVLLVIGDIKTEQAKKDMEQAFGKLAERDPSGWPAFLDGDWPRPQVRLVDKPNLTQSFIGLGFKSIPINSPDYFAYLVMNYILGGGGFSSRLPTVVRAQQGKTYGISSRFEAGLNAGPLMIRTFTQSAETYSMIKLMLSVLQEMKEKGITEDELKRAKANRIGGFALRFQTPEALASEILLAEHYGLGIDFLKTFTEKIDALTIEDINQAARRYLETENYRLVIVGNAEAVEEQLRPLGKIEKKVFDKPVD